MILQALTRYYEDLLTRGEIAAPAGRPRRSASRFVSTKTAR